MQEAIFPEKEEKMTQVFRGKDTWLKKLEALRKKQ